MKRYLLYGTNTSGEIGARLLESRNSVVCGCIDRKGVIVGTEIDQSLNVFKDKDDVPLDLLQNTDGVLVCVGQKETSIVIVEKFKNDHRYRDLIIESLFEDQYFEDYIKLKVMKEIFSGKGPLHDWGWLNSILKMECIDRQDNPIPWITYPALHFLENRISREMTVFEYGSGYSTLWWADKVKEVYTCEHDLKWEAKLRKEMPINVKMQYIELDYGGDYCKEVKKYKGEFDVVIVDGRDRVNCAMNAIDALKDDGVIIWDDTEREYYNDGQKYLEDEGFNRLDFKGMAALEYREKRTTIFYKDINCLGI
ncbi:hypothetical protein [Marinicrinis lubricantis]|uniref:FkbM family methyltransferase n=1 Tax=Marinicrinis lubricantis TaxID=2086470 RepID=A0ABW1IT55_9BACL